MKKLFWISMMGLAVAGTGCTLPIIDITSEPSRAAVSVDNEYIGKTPVTHEIKDNDSDTLVITVEKLCYESDLRRLKKKGGGLIRSGQFPKKVHFVLQPTRSEDCQR